MLTGRLRLINPTVTDDAIVCDFEILEYGQGAGPALPPAPAPSALPIGFDSDPHVAFGMLVAAMQAAGLDPVAVQRHGDQIIAALQAHYPGLDVYAHRSSDAIMWPGFGSLDVTIDSGKGGWSFRPDGVSPFGSGR
jgi:hypothetical protein